MTNTTCRILQTHRHGLESQVFHYLVFQTFSHLLTVFKMGLIKTLFGVRMNMYHMESARLRAQHLVRGTVVKIHCTPVPKTQRHRYFARREF